LTSGVRGKEPWLKQETRTQRRPFHNQPRQEESSLLGQKAITEPVGGKNTRGPNRGGVERNLQPRGKGKAQLRPTRGNLIPGNERVKCEKAVASEAGEHAIKVVKGRDSALKTRKGFCQSQKSFCKNRGRGRFLTRNRGHEKKIIQRAILYSGPRTAKSLDEKRPGGDLGRWERGKETRGGWSPSYPQKEPGKKKMRNHISED